MKRITLILLAALSLYLLYGVRRGFMDAARHGGSETARERRLAEISKKMNEGLPRRDGEMTRLEATTVGPGLTFTCLYKFPDHSLAQVDPAKLWAVARSKAIKAYTNNPVMADFRKRQVELHVNYCDKDGNEITTVVVSRNDL